MPGLRQTALAATTAAALVCIPIAPAAAAGPLLLAPWALGHVISAATRLATLPFAVASAAQTLASYPPPGYGAGRPGYYAAPDYYARAPAYYPGPQAYYPPVRYYDYARTTPRYYAPPRGDYAPRARYSGSYGSHVSYGSGGFAYRRR